MCHDVILLISTVHVHTMRNHSPLTSSLTLTPSRLFPILLDPKSFQTVLASVTWLLGHVFSIHCRLIIILTIFVQLTLTLAKVCPHSHLITLPTWEGPRCHLGVQSLLANIFKEILKVLKNLERVYFSWKSIFWFNTSAYNLLDEQNAQ